MDGGNRIWACLHNLVNIPREVTAFPGNSLKYVIEVDSGVPGSAKLVAEFSKADVAEAHGHLEVTWEHAPAAGAARPVAAAAAAAGPVRSSSCAQEWVAPPQQAALSVVVSIFEVNLLSNRRRLLGGSSSAPLSVDVRSVLERKVVTRIVGTTTGQVGISFSVSPHDAAGYKARLEDFLRKHNPNGLTLVPSVVASVSEIETFNKVFKKYNVIDYAKRVRLFFEMYGPEHIDAIPTTLKEWENREEELMRNLVLDNGPEPNDIDLRLRLLAFIERYGIRDLDIDGLLRAHRDDPSVLFASLTAKHGPEPDPRTYLYPAVTYSDVNDQPPPPQQQQQQQQHTSRTAVSSSATPVATAPPPVFAVEEPLQTASVSRLESMQSVRSVPQVGAALAPRTPAAQTMKRATPAAAAAAGTAAPPLPASASADLVELWSAFCNDLRRASIPPAELFYLSEASFMALVAELGYPHADHLRLFAEWQRRVKAALVQTHVAVDDAQFDAVRREVVTLSGLQALNVQVMAVTALKNSEHESSFALRLAAAKLRATERMIYVGDFNELVSFATYGFAPTPNQGRAILFKKRPFSHVAKPTTCSILVCDVIVGKPLVSVMEPPTPGDNFFASYDSCVSRVNTDDQGLLVYQPQQVIPRYLVHCTVDTTVTPCPMHPSRPVEFFVLDANAFACSQCVVLGQHRNREVLTLEDAALQAKAQLSEMAREVKSMRDDLAQQERDIERALQQLPQSEQWLAAKREADAIRREAELRAAEVMREAERHQEEQQAALNTSRQTLTEALREAQLLSEQLGAGSSLTTPQAIQMLHRLREGRALEAVRDRMMAVGNGAAGATAPPRSAHLPSLFGVRSTSTASTRTAAPLFAPAAATIGGSDLSRTPSMHHHAAPAAAAEPSGGDLFSKFVALKATTAPFNHVLPPQRDTNSTFGGPPRMAPAFASSSLQRVRDDGAAAISQAHENEARFTKEQMTRGWAAFRGGDKQQAQKIWSEVFERNPHNALGARARAYLAEAIERDYQTASSWYERALQIDPNDTMTLFNYAVLLESVLGKKREALELFEAAYRLGDHTAGRRAQLLRQQLHSN